VVEYVVDAFLKVKPEEVSPENILAEGPNYYLAIEWKGVILKARKLCVVGFVGEIRVRGRFTDVLVKSGEPYVTVRIWEERSRILEQTRVAEGAPVKVMGVLRVFRENPYITPVILRKVDSRYLEYFHRRMVEERDSIASYVRKLSGE